MMLVMLSIFVIIVWRGGLAFGVSFTYRSIFLFALGLFIILIAGFFLSLSSSTPIEIFGLMLICIIYLLWFISPLLLLRDIISFVYTIPPIIMIGLSCVWLAFGFYYGSYHIQVTPLTFVSDRITQDCTVVFVSDLHIEAIHNRQYVQTIVDRIQELQPDFVIIGGDLMNMGKAIYIDALLPFNQLTVPIYATLGNHDNMGDVNPVSHITEKTNIIVLRNQSIEVGGIQLVGIDDKIYRGSKALPMILQESQIAVNNQFTLLVSHQPQNLNKLVGYPIDLELAGHTHHGQFLPLSWIIRLFNDYSYGEYHSGDTTAFVSQGVGSWGAPLRLGTQREIVLISLKPLRN